MSLDQPREILSEARYLRLVRRGRWEFVERTNVCGIVGIVAVTDDRRIVLLEQYREAVQRWVIELPAGLAGDGVLRREELVEAARRELLEEAGYEALAFEFLTEGPPSAGLSAEVVTYFLAHDLRRVHAGGGVDGEQIRVHEVPLADADRWLKDAAARGCLVDPKMWLGLYFSR